MDLNIVFKVKLVVMIIKNLHFIIQSYNKINRMEKHIASNMVEKIVNVNQIVNN